MELQCRRKRWKPQRKFMDAVESVGVTAIG